MAQYCKLAGKATNCTDNCRICLEEETNDREIEIGDKIRYIAKDVEETDHFPPRGTIGTGFFNLKQQPRTNNPGLNK